MLIEQLQSISGSPMLPKFIVLLYIGFSALLLGGRGKPSVIRLLLPVFAVLLARDIAFMFFPYAAVIAVSDIAVFWVYLAWFRGFSGSLSKDVVAAAVSLVLILSVVALNVLNSVYNLVDPLFVRLAALAVLAHYVYFAIVLFAGRLTGNAMLVKKVRVPIIFFPLLANSMLLLLGYADPLVHAFILPFWYLVHVIVLITFSRGASASTTKEITDDSHLSSIIDFLGDIGQVVSDDVNLEVALQKTVLTAGRMSGADGCALLLLEEDDQERTVMVPKAIFGTYVPPMELPHADASDPADVKVTFEMTKIPLPQTPLGECVERREAVFIPDASADERMRFNQGADAMFVNSFIALPIAFGDQVHGVLSVVKTNPASQFSQIDFEHMCSFGRYTSVSLHNMFTYLRLLESKQVEHEVSIAADIQKNLLPRKLPQLPQLGAAAYSAASLGVSGDYYDMLPLNRGKKMGVMICDVAGKGIPAAMVMAIIRTILRLIAGAEHQPEKVLRWINRGIASQVGIERYATMSYLVFDAQSFEVTYSNAAHHPMVVYRAEQQEIEMIDTTGLPIGLDKYSDYGTTSVQLAPGDLLCLYTDGVSEAMNASGDQFGVERMTDLLRDHATDSSEEIVNTIISAVNSFAGDTFQHDDQTLMILKVNA